MENNMGYLDIVKLKIEYDTILSQVPENDIEEVKMLLDKKHQIMKKNGLLAERKINNINKKISKFIQKGNSQKKNV